VALRPATAPVAAATRLTPPSDTCKDKVFLSRQLCLQEECSKPIFQNFPACIKFREEARLREESKVRN
jgi:serine/threonine-protein kinase